MSTVRTSCFAAKNDRCCILSNQTTCKDCKFYKTNKQLNEELVKVHKRLQKINPNYSST